MTRSSQGQGCDALSMRGASDLLCSEEVIPHDHQMSELTSMQIVSVCLALAVAGVALGVPPLPLRFQWCVIGSHSFTAIHDLPL